MIRYGLFISLLLVITSCQEDKKHDAASEGATSSETGTQDARGYADLIGTYQGTLPCDNCEGIKMTLTLFDDKRFRQILIYQGDKRSAAQHVGRYSWLDNGKLLTLSSRDTTDQKFAVEMNQLIQLDSEGERNRGDQAEEYVLKKNYADPTLEDRKWMLTELNGEEITPGDTPPYFILESVTGRVRGLLVCNQIIGKYSLEPQRSINFVQVGNTMKGCDQGELENRIKDVFINATNYSLEGSTLILKRANMSDLAKFRAGSE